MEVNFPKMPNMLDFNLVEESDETKKKESSESSSIAEGQKRFANIRTGQNPAAKQLGSENELSQGANTSGLSSNNPMPINREMMREGGKFMLHPDLQMQLLATAGEGSLKGQAIKTPVEQSGQVDRPVFQQAPLSQPGQSSQVLNTAVQEQAKLNPLPLQQQAPANSLLQRKVDTNLSLPIAKDPTESPTKLATEARGQVSGKPAIDIPVTAPLNASGVDLGADVEHDTLELEIAQSAENFSDVEFEPLEKTDEIPIAAEAGDGISVSDDSTVSTEPLDSSGAIGSEGGSAELPQTIPLTGSIFNSDGATVVKDAIKDLGLQDGTGKSPAMPANGKPSEKPGGLVDKGVIAQNQTLDPSQNPAIKLPADGSLPIEDGSVDALGGVGQENTLDMVKDRVVQDVATQDVAAEDAITEDAIGKENTISFASTSPTTTASSSPISQPEVAEQASSPTTTNTTNTTNTTKGQPTDSVSAERAATTEAVKTQVVASGQSLEQIARNAGIEVLDLVKANPQLLRDPMLFAGQAITIPDASQVNNLFEKTALKEKAVDRTEKSKDATLDANFDTAQKPELEEASFKTKVSDQEAVTEGLSGAEFEAEPAVEFEKASFAQANIAGAADIAGKAGIALSGERNIGQVREENVSWSDDKEKSVSNEKKKEVKEEEKFIPGFGVHGNRDFDEELYERSRKKRKNLPIPEPFDAWADFIYMSAEKYNLDPALIASIIWRESGGNNIIGKNGFGFGLMQIDSRIYGDWLKENEDGLNPATNIDFGASILRQNIDYFGGRTAAGIAAFDCGIKSVEEAMVRRRSVDYFTREGNYSFTVLTQMDYFQRFF